MNNFIHGYRFNFHFVVALIFSFVIHLLFIEGINLDNLLLDKSKEKLIQLEITIQEDNLIAYTDVPEELVQDEIISKKSNVEELVIPEIQEVTSQAEIEQSKIVSQAKSKVVEIKSSSESVNQEQPSIIDTSQILSKISELNLFTKSESKKGRRRIKAISSRSPEYIYKLYFESWRNKVERMGAMNYPEAAKNSGIFGSLIMTVSINSEGMIEKMIINKGSGQKALDEAAMNIVKMGEPYAKFSNEMKKEVDIINITRRWKFTEDNNFSSRR